MPTGVEASIIATVRSSMPTTTTKCPTGSVAAISLLSVETGYERRAITGSGAQVELRGGAAHEVDIQAKLLAPVCHIRQIRSLFGSDRNSGTHVVERVGGAAEFQEHVARGLTARKTITPMQGRFGIGRFAPVRFASRRFAPVRFVAVRFVRGRFLQLARLCKMTSTPHRQRERTKPDERSP